ncbi:MAG: LuxR C-terminal-related transcriptional regulator [Treponema sp.]|nr:LuxR C-terminal-related transcriptional regulator [Treponema sp.]
MEDKQQTQHNPYTIFHYRRARLNKLFMEAMKYPLVVVCAGAGYGKTSAVHDFAEEYGATTAWIQLSERDNVGARFLENCVHTIGQINPAFAEAAIKLGFPYTKDKLKQCASLMRDHVKKKRRIIVFDDFHYIEDISVIRFLEECIINSMPPGTSVFMLSRSSPRINIASLISKRYIFNINEDDLLFTENETARYFQQMNINLNQENLREIMRDTEGWAFAINLIAHSYQKAPGYSGYARNAMKTSIFQLMETEIWDGISKELHVFFIRLSLIEHLSVDLITLLAEGNANLIGEFEKQNAYVRRDNYINAYLIHPLFLEFLTAKQNMLTEEQKRQTYEKAGLWCNKNGFKIDALSYYEKIEDYQSIVSILFAFPAQIPYDIAKYASAILDRAPEHMCDSVEFFVYLHLSVYMSQGLWEKSTALAEHYEAKFLKQNETSFRNNVLSTLYYSWACLRVLLCIMDDRYDFDLYFEKFCKYCVAPLDLNKLYNNGHGPWINAAGSSRKGALQEFIDALSRTLDTISKYFNNLKTGIGELARGELEFYQGELHEAETFFMRALELAKKYKQFEVIHRTLFYILRLSIVQGNYSKAEQALNEMKVQLEEDRYVNRFVNYDIALCWYYCVMGMEEKAPAWLTEGFSPYGHASYIENFANQMKALFFYNTRNYPPLLSYIQEMKQRESFLYGRAEMLAMEACVYYKMKDKQQALASLKEAYKTASPNNLLMPFIEMGKDMRTLIGFALKKQDVIPKSWLETVNRKSASYAKRLAHVIAEYKKANSIVDIPISAREAEILMDLSHGLSRSEIAANKKLSINTVKMVINNIYMKLGAENLADAIRIATERKIV